MESLRRPLISVVMPVYDAAASLFEAVDSIRQQDFRDWELVAVDDGSGDESREILKGFARSDERIRVLELPHSGIVSALNAGLRASRGTYIARMDADDRSLPGRLLVQSSFLEEHPGTGLVGGHTVFAGSRGDARGYAEYVDWCNSVTTFDEISLSRFIESPFPHPSVMFRRELLDFHGGYREGDFPEDYDLWLRWLEAGVRMEKVRAAVVEWADPPGRLSRVDPRYRVSSFYALKASYLARWLTEHNPHHPELLLWGAGRITRQRASFLADEGVSISAYIDIDAKKIGNRIHGIPVIAPENIPAPGECFVLPFVGSRDARALIEDWLLQRAYRKGADFISAA